MGSQAGRAAARYHPPIMATFPGGSAYMMAREISEGYFLVTERTFQRFGPPELDKLLFELDRLLREIRGDQPALDDLAAIKTRNRRISRLNTAAMILKAYRQRYRV
jgi:hypothetical protein